MKRLCVMAQERAVSVRATNPASALKPVFFEIDKQSCGEGLHSGAEVFVQMRNRRSSSDRILIVVTLKLHVDTRINLMQMMRGLEECLGHHRKKFCRVGRTIGIEWRGAMVIDKMAQVLERAGE